jgi:hypothetical protein
MLEKFAFLSWVVTRPPLMVLSHMVLSRLVYRTGTFAYHGFKTETRSPDNMCFDTLSDLRTTCTVGA